MTAWEQIATAPRDRTILVRGGNCCGYAPAGGGGTWFCNDQTGPAVVSWQKIKYGPRDIHEGWYMIDCLKMIDEPNEWAEIPS